jgi:glutamyl-tRNA synthetase
MKARGNTLVELAGAFEFLRGTRPMVLNSQARKALKPDSLALLAALHRDLDTLEDWTPEGLEGALKEFVGSRKVSMGAIGPALRAALTGGLPAPELKFVLYWLGRTEALSRIADQLNDAGQEIKTDHGR